MTTDEKIHNIAVASIRRRSIEPGKWIHTQIATLHSELNNCFALEPDELPIVSAFFSPESWYIFTTRRITSFHNGNLLALNPTQGLECHFGNFKGYPIGSNTYRPTVQTEIATITASHTNTTIQFKYETGNASMAPIYAAKYWQQKHPTPNRPE
jgi:hypothetical protein